MLDVAGDASCTARLSREESRGAHQRTDFPAATTSDSWPLAGLPRAGRRRRVELPAGDDHPLATRRAGVREVASCRTAIISQVTRYQPERRGRADDCRRTRCPLREVGRPRRPQPHQGPARRHPVLPLVLPDGHLRQLRHDRQRRPAADLRHLPRRLRARTRCASSRCANFPVIRDLVVEIGDFMRQAADGQAVARSATSDEPVEGEYLQTPASWTTTSSSACASTACCATRPARSTALDPSSSARRPSPWRSATTSTRATRARTTGCDVLATAEGVWACTFVGECSTACPRAYDRGGDPAVQARGCACRRRRTAHAVAGAMTGTTRSRSGAYGSRCLGHWSGHAALVRAVRAARTEQPLRRLVRGVPAAADLRR